MGYQPDLFAKAVEIILKDETIGSIIYVREPDRFAIFNLLLGLEDIGKNTIDSLIPILKNSDKPIICTPAANRENVADFEARHNFQRAMIDAGLPMINYIAEIPPVLMQLYYYGKFLNANRSD